MKLHVAATTLVASAAVAQANIFAKQPKASKCLFLEPINDTGLQTLIPYACR